MDISDALAVLFLLFEGEDVPCPEAANADDDARIGVGDAMAILEALFRPGRSLPAPFPGCGVDPNLPTLGCLRSACP